MSQTLDDILGITQAKKDIEALGKQMSTLVSQMEKVSAKTDATKNSKAKDTKDLNTATQEYFKTAKQLETVEGKLAIAETNKNKQLIEARLNLQKSNATIKEEIKLRNVQKGALKDVEFRLKKLVDEYSATAKPSKQLIKDIQTLDKESKKLRKQIGDNTKSVGGYAEGFKNAGTSLLGFSGIVGGVLLATRAFFGAIKGGITTIRDFSSAQSTLASVLGVSKKEIKNLTDDSLKYGSTTQYTAVQVSNLQTELAKLGFTQREIKDTTGSILDFATATGAELPDAAKVSGIALRAFGLEAKEIGRVTSALAVATTKSALSFSDYETILATVAPVARAYGFSLEDTIALTGKLKDAGFDASSAATATRNILLNLADANGDLAKSLGGSVSSFDELIPALDKLDKSGIDLNSTLQLTDKRSVAAFNTFLKTSSGAKDLRDSITGVESKLKDMVKVKLDNLEGDTIALSSAWDGLLLSFRSSEGILRKVTQATTKLVSAITSLVAPTEKKVNLYKLENKEANVLLNTLKSSNLTSEARKKLIVQINDEYGEYLPNLLTEKSTLDEIEIAQKAINKQLRLKVLQQAFQEEINDLLKKELEATEGLVNANIKREKINQNYDPNISKEELDFQQNLLDLSEQVNKSVIDNNKDEIESTRDKFKRIGELYGILLSEIEANTVDVITPDTITTTQAKAIEIKEIVNRELEDIGDIPESKSLKKYMESQLNDTLDFEREHAAEVLKIYEENAKRIKSIEKSIFDAKVDLLNQGLDLATEVSNRQAENKIADIDKEQTALNENFELQKIAYEGNADALLEIENRQIEANKQKEAEKKKIEIDAAKRARAFAIAQRLITVFKIGLNTAEAATSALAIPPAPNLVLAGLTKTLGALEAAAVLAQPLPPIPKLFTGIKDFEGGMAVVGDKYGHEGVILPSGEKYITPDKDTLAYLPKHTEVVPNKDLATHPEFGSKIKDVNSFDDSRLLKELRRMNRSNSSVNITADGIFKVVQTGNNRSIYENKLLGKC